MLGDFCWPVSMLFDSFDDLFVPFSCVVQNALRKIAARIYDDLWGST